MAIYPAGGRPIPATRRVRLAAALLLVAVLGCAPAGPTPAGPTPAASPSSVVAIPSASPVPSPSPTLPPIPEAGLQAVLDRLRVADGIPGVSVAIAWDDGRTWTGVSGHADLAADTPVTAGTAFALASISKTFTAAVVLELVGEGGLSLDDPATRWLPAYRLDPRITVRMLLDHTSGLPDFFQNPAIDAAMSAALDATWTPARSWTFVGKPKLVPGRAWLYSNTNYLLLGELVTEVTGNPLATEIRTRLLDPLGLGTAWYQAVEMSRAPLATAYNLAKAADGGLTPSPVAPPDGVMPFRAVVTASAGAGSMAATALDTARWMQAFAGGHVLSAAMQRVMLDDAAVTAALHASIITGLGLQVVTIDGRRSLGHAGRYAGVRDVVRYLPDAGITIAVLTNQSVADPQAIAGALLDLLLPPLPAPTSFP